MGAVPLRVESPEVGYLRESLARPLLTAVGGGPVRAAGGLAEGSRSRSGDLYHQSGALAAVAREGSA